MKVVQNLVCEYVNSSLDKMLHSYRKAGRNISLTNCKILMRGVLKGMDYLHALNIAHRDIKPDNILVQLNASFNVVQVKIADFGQAKVVDSDKLTNAWIQSKNYRAPEV